LWIAIDLRAAIDTYNTPGFFSPLGHSIYARFLNVSAQDSMNIPTEPIGTIPRPLKLIEAIAKAGDCADPALDLF